MTIETTPTLEEEQQQRKYAVADTSADDASPSASVLEDVHRTFRLIDDERHLCADTLYQSIRTRIQQHKEQQQSQQKPEPRANRFAKLTGSAASSSQGASSPSRFTFRNRAQHQPKIDEYEEAQKLLEVNSKALDTLEQRCRLFREAKRNLSMNDDWTLAQKLFGVTTYYRRETDGSLSIKMEGDVDGVPLFDQVAVLREVDLHYRWAPFCSSSLTVAHLNKLDTVGWFAIGLPNFGLMRDGCFRIIGCDSVAQDNTFILFGQGIADRQGDPGFSKRNKKAFRRAGSGSRKSSAGDTDSDGSFDDVPDDANVRDEDRLRNDPILKELDIPETPSRMGAGRMTIRKFQASIQVHSATRASTKVIANINPHLSFIPQSLLEFVMKKMCGVLIYKLQQAAKKVSKDSVSNHHARKMRQDEDFYRGWLMTKFAGICNIRGWDMPTVAALEVAGPQLEHESFSKHPKRGNSEPILPTSRSTIPEMKPIQHAVSDTQTLDPAISDSIDKIDEFDFISTESPALEKLHHSDSDVISEMSGNSATSTQSGRWRSNLIVNYLKEIEERIQKRKQGVVEDPREKAAERLRPKLLDTDTQHRLLELRAAKSRRNERGPAARTINSTNSGSTTSSVGSHSSVPFDDTKSSTESHSSNKKQNKDNSPNDWVSFLGSQSVSTRLFVTTVLVMSLFSVLHLDAISRWSPQMFLFDSSVRSSWHMEIAKDALTMSYLIVSAVAHFLLCYAVLVYSFATLDLGMKAGNHARRFYSSNVHLIVGLSSLSIIVMGSAKAILGIVVRDIMLVVSEGRQVNWYEWRHEAFAFSRLLFSYSSIFLLVLVVLFHLSARVGKVRPQS